MLKQSSEERVIISDAIESILEAYFDRYSVEMDSLIESYSNDFNQNNANGEPKRYERGVGDAIFLIYAANNRSDFEDILKSCVEEDVEKDDLKVLRRLYRESNAKIADESALVKDCKKLSTSETVVLKLEMAKFLKGKCNQYLSENYKERFEALENDFDAQFNAILQPSSESDQSNESDKKRSRSPSPEFELANDNYEQSSKSNERESQNPSLSPKVRQTTVKYQRLIEGKKDAGIRSIFEKK